MSPFDKNLRRNDNNYMGNFAGVVKSSKNMKISKRTPLSILSENIEYDLNNFQQKIYTSNSFCSQSLSSDSSRDKEFNLLKYIPAPFRKFWKSSFASLDLNIYSNIYSEIFHVQSQNLNVFIKNKQLVSPHPYVRSTLVEWLTDVSHTLAHAPETIFMAINYMDRYLSLVPAETSKLQLIGATCLYISTKLNDLKVPRAKDFSYLSDDYFSIDNILTIEKHILFVLEFNLVTPTVLFFSEFYSLYFNRIFNNKSIFIYMQALCEFTLIENHLSTEYHPNVLAAAIIMATGLHYGTPISIDQFNVFKLDFISLSNCFQHLMDFITHIDECPFLNHVKRFKMFDFNSYRENELLPDDKK